MAVETRHHSAHSPSLRPSVGEGMRGATLGATRSTESVRRLIVEHAELFESYGARHPTTSRSEQRCV